MTTLPPAHAEDGFGVVLSPCWGRVCPAADADSRSRPPWRLCSQILRLKFISRQLLSWCGCVPCSRCTLAASPTANSHRTLRMGGSCNMVCWC